MKIWSAAASVAMACLTSGCGGDGGPSSSNVTLPPTSATPSPTPSPTPLPTPSPTYRTFVDLLADWEANTPYAFVEYVGNDVSGSAIQNPIRMSADIQEGDVQVNFTGRPTISASYSDFKRGKSVTFAEKDLAFNNEESGLALIHYIENGGYAMIGAHRPHFILNRNDFYKFKYSFYPWAIYKYRNNDDEPYKTLAYYYILGDKTVSNKIPKYEGPGSWLQYNYASFLFQPFLAPDDPNFPFSASGSIVFSPDNDRISGYFQYNDSTTTDQGLVSQLNLTGTTSTQGHRISGTISSSNGIYSGTFQGDFYGKDGKEIGLFFVIRSKMGGFTTSGVIAGAWFTCTNYANGVILDETVCS